MAQERTSFFRAGAVVEADAGEIGRDDGRWICEPSPAPALPPLVPPPGTGHSCEERFVEAARDTRAAARLALAMRMKPPMRPKNPKLYGALRAYQSEPFLAQARRSFRRQPCRRWGSSDWSHRPSCASAAVGRGGGGGCWGNPHRHRRRCCYCCGGARRRAAAARAAEGRCSASAAPRAGSAWRAPPRRRHRRRRGCRRRCRRRHPGLRRRRRR